MLKQNEIYNYLKTLNKHIILSMEAKEKRKRPDRQKKLEDRKSSVETVVKSALLKYLQGDECTKEKACRAIQERVVAYSLRTNMASIVLSGIFKTLFHDVDDVVSVDVPDITNQTFARQLLLGTTEANIPVAVIQQYFESHPQCITTTQRHLDDANIYSAGAKTYTTNLKNSLKMNLSPRMKRFTKQFGELNGLGKDESSGLFFEINGWPLPHGLGCLYPSRECVVNVVKEHRRVLGLAEGQSISKSWLKETSNVGNMIRYYVSLTRFNEHNGLATFNIVPMCRMGSHFISIDTQTLYGVMRDVDLISVELTRNAFVEMGGEHWKSFFKIDKLQGNNKFTGTIQTDGTSVCTHFIRPINEQDIFQRDMKLLSADQKHKKKVLPSVELQPNDRVIGIDPGRSNIIFGAEPNDDGSFKRYVLTRKRYYSESGIFAARKRTETWSKGIQKNLILMSTVSTKGSNLDKHEAFIATYMENYDAIWNEYFKARWARQRLRLYGGKQRVFANLINKIKNHDISRRVVIAYGSATFAPGGKNEISVPTSSTFKKFARAFPTVVVDEFRTTRIHHEDGSLLQSVKRRDTDEWLRGLLWCSSTNNTKFVNRDLNAAINIRRCVTNPVRPLELRRVEGQPRLPNYVLGKIIKC
jgi:hypothetical protein